MTEQTKQRINSLSQAMRTVNANGWETTMEALIAEFETWAPLNANLENSAEALGELASTSLIIDDMRERVASEIARHATILQQLRTLQSSVIAGVEAFDKQTTRLVPDELVGTYMVGTWPIRVVTDSSGVKVFRKIQAEPLEHTG